jgi:hypothetical protein
MRTSIALTQPGEFVVGCNYWASHAGTFMWRDWRPEVVDRDLRLLSEAGLQVLRVFPLWPDFQPLTNLLGGGGSSREFRHGEAPLPDDDCGQAGLSAEMLDRFAHFLDLAEKHELKLIVGLVTGWMSGRLHLPPAFERLNPLTDARVIRWELRMIRHFVHRFKDHPAVAGWDLGNECNCMGQANREQAFIWTATIANAIRVADPSRPVVSGLHGLTPQGEWTMQDQGELTDLLTTHPYPVFTPHCDQDPINTIRTIMHSTAESRFYADIGGKPCLCQEIGTLGPMLASERIAADFARSCMFSLWANDCHGLVWWCAFDQTHLTHAPYDWNQMERELGLIRVDGSAEPVLETMGAFCRMLASMPFDALPPHTREALCILTEGQDHWGVAYSSYVLAKQAGFDIEFQYAEQPIREARLYLMPCLAGHSMVSGRRMRELLAKVEAGATLYLSLDTGLPSEFRELVGLEAQTRERRREFNAIRLGGLEGVPSIPCAGGYKVRFTPVRAQVLGEEDDGSPAFTVAGYGRGKVFFLNTPMELTVTRTPGVLHTPEAPPCWSVYRHVAADVIRNRVVSKQQPMVGVTEHPCDAGSRVIVAINYSPEKINTRLTLARGWVLEDVLYGAVEPNGECALPANDAAVFLVKA